MSVADIKKRQEGRFYTEGNPFALIPFTLWARKMGLKEKKVLEPFAGANNIVHALQQHGYAKKFASFDINPQNPDVQKRDTLAAYPKSFEVCITNPPWLAKNSARRRGLAFPDTPHDDLYKYALELSLAHSSYVAALIPATFLQSRIFLNRLATVVFLHDQRMFLDTDNPVCLALFVPQSSRVEIYHDNELVGDLSELESLLPRPHRRLQLEFNHPEGEIGFIAFDDTRAPSIRFCLGEELEGYHVGDSSRMITRIKADVPYTARAVKKLNQRITEFREATSDVFLTPFKGLRKDGMYRRRMDYRLARHFIETYA